MAFLRQTGTLVSKNLLIVLGRHGLATVVRALILPLALTVFLSFARNLFVPPAVFGVGDVRPVRSLPDALAESGRVGRDAVVFVNAGGVAGGDIERVIDRLAAVVVSAGKKAPVLTSEADLPDVCPSSLRGVTPCYGAVVFYASPREGPARGLWNYTIRSDSALGSGKIDVRKDTNDAEIYMFPLQHAVDAAIANLTSSDSSGSSGSSDSLLAAGGAVDEYPFTSLTQEERADRIRVLYQKSLMGFLGVSFVSGVIGICYHMTGFIASERESGMSTLIEAMMPTRRRWEAQAARLLSYHLSFSLLYLPGWVIGSLVLRQGVFAHTSVAVVLVYHVLAGLALASMSLFGAAFFRRSQLSGVSVTIVYLLLAIVAQTITSPGTATVAALSLLFAPANYTFFITLLARWEQRERPADLTRVAPNSPWHLSGIVLWIFLVGQILVYPVLGALLERYFHGTASSARNVVFEPSRRDEDGDRGGRGGAAVDSGTAAAAAAGAGDDGRGPAVRLEQFTKVYEPGLARRLFSFVSRPKDPVVAVDRLTLSAGRGQILVLLGANGSGKSTTLDSVAGITKPTSGAITVDGTGGLGIAPQKNVLWDELTVEEHVRIFNRLKAPRRPATRDEIRRLVRDIDLDRKMRAPAKTLSGGQKRKLQLGMMLTGGSAVCCVDEVSSGLDPLSRRKIWDILLAERGRRTIIMTTHFLDEADLLADHIAIMSKGRLRAEGASVQLKDRLGGGYRIHVQHVQRDRHDHPARQLPDVDGVAKKAGFDSVTYVAPSSSLAARVIQALEALGVHDYRFSGPTIEDVFLQLAEEVRAESSSQSQSSGSHPTFLSSPPGGSEEENPQDHPPTAQQPQQQQQQQQQQSSHEKPAARSEKVVGLDDDPDRTVEKEEEEKEEEDDRGGLQLLSGQPIGYLRQTGVLFLKRCTIFKGNWFPYAAAFLIPVVAAGLVTLFVRDQQPVGCTPGDQSSLSTAIDIFSSDFDFFLVGGPSSRFHTDDLLRLFLPLFESSVDAANASSGSGGSSAAGIDSLLRNITTVDTYGEFTDLVVRERKNVTPAGIWLGDATSAPTVAYKANGIEMFDAWFGQWVLDMLLANTTIASSYVTFDIPWAPSTGKSLQLLVYVGLALSAYPGFFALYPNLERRRHVRGLEYSNGVRTAPLWLAYIAFDFAIVLVSSALVTILFAALSHVWYHVAYLFLVFLLYGLAATLLAYLISLFCANQLSAYAFAAAGQAVLFLVYIIAYLCTITYAPVNRVDDYLLLVHFLVSAFAPIGSVVRSLFLALNLFSTACVDKHLAANPGGILQYGGPILYLIVQSVLLFGLLVWLDGGDVGSSVRRLLAWRRKSAAAGEAEPEVSDEEVANELLRVTTSATATATAAGGDGATATTEDGLQVVHLTKTFGKNTAVDNVTFGVRRGEVFALLGPNGAGKSTTISLIRGDIKPSGRGGGDVFVDGISVSRHLAAAREHLGVCPQFDAIDQMTVAEHLRFYARVRGIPDVEHNVGAVLRAVGLAAFRDRQAHALSGGNKRKLSLGIALMGNPTVVLLDEPSSGLDAAAKRVMWRTLAATVPGRSILLTTHSMEEADALAGRAGILARRMLAMGTTERLRRRFGDALHVHVVCRGAPRTPDEEVERVRRWVVERFGPEAKVEEKTYHGQMRFSVPAAAAARVMRGDEERQQPYPASGEEETEGEESSAARSALGRLVVLLEENKEALGIEHYSVSPTTLDEVFLAVVGKHGVQEEGYQNEEDKKKGKKSWWRLGKK